MPTRRRALSDNDLDRWCREDGWRTALENAAREGDALRTQRVLSSSPPADALEYVEARGLLAKVAKDAGGGRGGVEVCRMLLALGAAVDLSVDPAYRQVLALSGHAQGGTPLCWAAIKGHLALAEMLLAAGAEVDILNEKGCTPLFMAACNGRRDCCVRLLAAGADADATTTDGKALTPITVAEVAGHTLLAEEMREVVAGTAVAPAQAAAVAEATGMKETGNVALQGGNMYGACAAYTEGLRRLEGPSGTGALGAVAYTMGGKVIKCPSPLNVLKYTYDHSCY
jgi:hypothetical protein